MSDLANVADVKAEVVCDHSASVKNIGISHYFAMYVWLGWYHFFPQLLVTAPLLWIFVSKYLVIGIFVLIVISGVSSIEMDKQPSWGLAIGNWYVHKAKEYFGLKLTIENKEDLSKLAPGIFVLEPHDVLPVSIFAFCEYLKLIPGHKVIGCLTSACFAVPLMRHIFTWGTASSVDKKNIEKLLKNGYSVSLCPGGVQEVTAMATIEQPKEVIIFLKSRLGVVKLALKYGVSIVPSFCFGQRQMYSFWVPSFKWVHSLGRKIGFVPMIFAGIFGIPYSQPKPTPLSLIVGKPIPVPKVEGDPTPEVLAFYHDKLLSEMERIFNDHKHQHGMGDHKLRII